MPTAILRGDAIDQPRILKVVPASVEIGDVFRLGIPDFVHDRFVEYEAQEASVHDVVAGLAAAIGETDIPEFEGIEAVGVDDDEDDEFEWLRITGPEGVHFEMSGSTTNTSIGTVEVTENTSGSSGKNEIQKVELKGNPTGGTWDMQWDPGTGTETAGGIAHGATAADVENAMVAGMASVGSDDVAVTGEAGGPWFVQFKGTYANTDVNLIQVVGTSLTGNGEIEITTTTQGFPAGNKLAVIQSKSDLGSFTLTVNGETTGNISIDSTDAEVQTAIADLSGVPSDSVEVFGGAVIPITGGGVAWSAGWLIHFKGQFAGEQVSLDADFSGLNTESNVLNHLTDGGEDPADEVQFIDLGGATSGTFILELADETTSEFGWDADASTVQDQLNQLGAVASPGVTVYEAPNGIGYFVHFEFNDAGADQPEIVLHDFTDGTGGGVTTVQHGGPGTDEVQEVAVSGSDGDFTLTFDGQTTAAIAYGSTAGTLETELEGLSNITDVTVSGTGTPDDPYVVTFLDPGSQDVPEMTGDPTNLTGGDGKVTVAQNATGPTDEIQDVTLDATVSGGDFTLTFRGAETNPIPTDAAAGTVESELEALSTIDGVSVVSITDGWRVTFDTGNVAGRDLELMSADGAGLVGGSGTETLVITEHQRGAGRNFFDDPTNWVRGRIPDSLDDLVLQDGETDLLYGLRQRLEFTVDTADDTLLFSETPDFRDGQKLRVTSDGTLPGGLAAGTDYYVVNLDRDNRTLQLATSQGGSAVDITSSGSGTHVVGLRLNSFVRASQWTGRIGLPDRREDGTWEYLPKALAIGLASAGEKTLRFGDGDGPGASLNRIDLGPDRWDLMVLDTGSGTTGLPALQLTGDHPDNAQTILEGEVGFAFFAGETTSLKGLTMRGGRVQLGDGVSLAGTIDRSDGQLISRGADITSAVFEWN